MLNPSSFYPEQSQCLTPEVPPGYLSVDSVEGVRKEVVQNWASSHWHVQYMGTTTIHGWSPSSQQALLTIGKALLTLLKLITLKQG